MFAVKKLLLIACCALCFGSQVLAQSNIRGLPKGAVIVETRKVWAAGHAHRALVLWVLSPTKHPTDYGPNDPYSCPDETRGSHYSGPTRVSLVNSATNTILNTLKISEDEAEAGD